LLPAGFGLAGGELPLPSVLDLLSDDAAGLDSALPPSPFGAESFPADSFGAESFEVDSFAFFRDSDG
jgi:hypothetical protein